MHRYFLLLLASFLLKHAFSSKIQTPKIGKRYIICFTRTLNTELLTSKRFSFDIVTRDLAVIGGGIGAASTTHFLTELFNNDLKIDLYEANKIGGRLATIKIDDNEYEAGGSIIHQENKYMQEFLHLLGTFNRLILLSQ